MLQLVAPSVETPAAPTGILKASKLEWVGFWKSGVAGQVSIEADLPALVDLFHAQDELRRALRLWKREPFLTGSKGQTVLNPIRGPLALLPGGIGGVTAKARALDPFVVVYGAHCGGCRAPFGVVENAPGKGNRTHEWSSEGRPWPARMRHSVITRGWECHDCGAGSSSTLARRRRRAEPQHPDRLRLGVPKGDP